MHITSDDLTGWIGSYLWALIRIAALITAAPVIGSHSIPARIKLGFSLALTMVIVPILPQAPAVDPFSADAFLITLHQILIGAAMGLVFQLVFTMFVIGGQVLAYQMGLGFSQMVDPQSGTHVPVVSQFYIVVITLLFFSMNGHLAMIEVLIESFTLLPITPSGISTSGYWLLIEWSKEMFVGGLKIALPAVASILLINFSFAVVTRSAPQFNVFTLGFPITIVVGFFIIMATLTTIVPHFVNQYSTAIEVIRSVMGAR